MNKQILVVLLSLSFWYANFAQNITVTAHRGASGYAPENTIASVREAIKMNADFTEIDVQETNDGAIILLHDKNLKRTTGLDKNIWECSYKEINNLDAGKWFHPQFAGEIIPLLSDVIDFSKGKIKMNIELKSNGHEKMLADRVVKIVQEKNFVGECFYTSFDYSLIKRVKEINPTLKVGLIFKKMPETLDVFNTDMELLSVHYSLVDESFVLRAKSAGKEVHVWTVNEEDEMRRLINLGVTSIITNYPDILKRLLKFSN